MTWTETDILRTDTQSHSAFVRRREQMNRHELDLGVHQRRRERLCKYCFYFREESIAGRAFTRYQCRHCGNEFKHPNTNIPRLCNGCADERGLCVRCGGSR